MTPHVREHWGVTQDQSTAKSALRLRLRSARKQRDLRDIAQLDLHISGHIFDALGRLALSPASVVATYVPMPYEPPVNALRSQLQEMGCAVFIPLVSGNELLWAPDGNEEHWEPNKFGTREPDRSGAQSSSQALPDCAAIVIPALAISPHGFRLGQGKGFYDRALPKIAELKQPPLIIGVSYESEFLLEIPTEEHDIPVDVSVTESTVRWF